MPSFFSMTDVVPKPDYPLLIVSEKLKAVHNEMLAKTKYSAAYQRVAKEYGFTERETTAWYQANDSGATFAELAEILASTPIPHSSNYTAERKKQEAELCDKLFELAQKHLSSSGYVVPLPKTMWKAKSTAGDTAHVAKAKLKEVAGSDAGLAHAVEVYKKLQNVDEDMFDQEYPTELDAGPNQYAPSYTDDDVSDALNLALNVATFGGFDGVKFNGEPVIESTPAPYNAEPYTLGFQTWTWGFDLGGFESSALLWTATGGKLNAPSMGGPMKESAHPWIPGFVVVSTCP